MLKQNLKAIRLQHRKMPVFLFCDVTHPRNDYSLWSITFFSTNITCLSTELGKEQQRRENFSSTDRLICPFMGGCLRHMLSFTCCSRHQQQEWGSPVLPFSPMNHIRCLLFCWLSYQLSCHPAAEDFLKSSSKSSSASTLHRHTPHQYHCGRHRICLDETWAQNAKCIETWTSIWTRLAWNDQRSAITSNFSSFLPSPSEPQGWPQHCSCILTGTRNCV